MKVRVRGDELDAARAALAPMLGTDGVAGAAGGDGWLSVRVAPERAADVNRLLSQAGIYASSITAGSDLEALFLELTGGEEKAEPAA